MSGTDSFADGLDASQAFDPSLALGCIVSWDEHGIVARSRSGIDPSLALEAMAQACGMHLRRLQGFAARAFLASVTDLTTDSSLGSAPLTIRATLTARTSAGASYDVAVDGGPSCRMLMGFEAQEHPDTFFRERFEALCTPSCSD